MSLRHPENKAALLWFSEELRRHETGKASGHAKITVDIVDKKAHKLEPGERILITALITEIGRGSD